MEFKFRAVDKPATTSDSLSQVTYLPDRSLHMNGGFSGFRQGGYSGFWPPLTGEEALRRELEKEVIRREILRRMELEEEVRRELGISTQRALNIHGLVSQWSNSTATNPVSVSHIGAPQPPLVLPPTEINPFPEISNMDKVIVLDKPDPKLFNAKRNAATLIEPSALDFKKKLKEEWSCALCEIKATSESGLKAHLNGKKHKIKEAKQNKKICQSNISSEKTSVTATKLEVDVEKGQHEQHSQPFIPLEVMDENIIDKGIQEPKQEEQLVEKMADNSVSAAKSTNEKGESASTCSVSTKAPKRI